MLFGRLLEPSNENGDGHLLDMERELRTKI